MTLDQFNERKRIVDALRRKEAELAGAQAQLKRQLKEEFNVNTIAEAEKLAKRLTREAEELAERHERDWAAWERKYGSKVLEG